MALTEAVIRVWFRVRSLGLRLADYLATLLAWGVFAGLIWLLLAAYDVVGSHLVVVGLAVVVRLALRGLSWLAARFLPSSVSLDG
jgi:hypothetical protein